jgi:ligand-binding sensor domain-containing protein
MVDDAGTIFAGTDGGAARLNGETFEAIERTSGRGIYGMVVDPNGNYWFSGDGGLARFDPARADWEFFDQERGLPAYTLLGAARDADGNLYFGSLGAGLIRYDGQSFSTWSVPNQPPGHAFSYILPKADGPLWFVQEYSSAADQYDPNLDTWSAVTLPCENCAPLRLDAAGTLYFGGGDGVWIAPPNNADPIHLTIEQGLPSNNAYVLAIHQSDGHLLVGTDAGVAHVEGSEVTATFNQDNSGFASNNVRTIYSAQDGSIWVSVDGGLSRLMPDGQWEHYTIDQPFGPGFNFATGLVEDTNGTLWVATGNDGAWSFRDGAWTSFPTASLNTVAAAPDGSVWFGTYYSGALHFDGANWTTFGSAEDLIHPNVNYIYVEPSGTVWFATSGGVSRFRP